MIPVSDQQNAILGNTGIKVSAPVKMDPKISKYALLRQVQSILDGSTYAVLSCQKMIGSYAQVMRSGDGAYIDGVITCKSVWTCPVCCERITCQRLDLLGQALRSGYKTVMVTATLQHNKFDRLQDLLQSLKGAIRKLKSGRWWSSYKDRYGVVAYVSSYEITYGRFGWHPHVHMLLFLDCDLVDLDLMWSELVSRYVYLVGRGGRYASKYHAVDVVQGDCDADQYLLKHVDFTDGLAYEMSSTDTKSGRMGSFTCWDLVAMSEKNIWSGRLFREYCDATFRLQSFIWSRGAKKVLGIKDTKQERGQAVAMITRPVWTVIKQQSLQDYVLELAVMDSDQLQKFIDDLTDAL